MLIHFDQLISKHNIQPKGVLHVGANTGQEAKAYYDNGIKKSVWVEADPDIFTQLQAELTKGNFPQAVPIQAACWYTDGMPMSLHVTDNNGESSSLLPMGTHSQVHPSVHVVGQKPMVTKRLDTMFAENALQIEDYDFLNMDIQGAELHALKGMGDLIDKIKYAYLEVNKKELYKGCALFPAIIDFMHKKGFALAEESWAGDTGWGDAFFIRKELFTENKTGQYLSQTGGIVLPNGVTLVPEPPTYAVDISLAKLVKKYHLPIRGIINAGAHTGADMHQYKEAGIKNIMLLEPNIENFNKMQLMYSVEAAVHNVALSDFSGNMQMYLSTGDEGRSNSLLWPNIHLTQYPHIKYPGGQANVTAEPLDKLNVDIGKYNALHIDVNGYELPALRGCLTFLHSCDYIYTRVYFADLFQGNAQVTDVDLYLQQFGFKRVETSKEGQTWGFALYMKTTDPLFPKQGAVITEFKDAEPAELKNAYLEATPDNEFVANVPAMFREHIKNKLPVDNVIPFEEWYYKAFSFADQVADLIYLPIFWNSYYTSNDVENKPGYVEELQEYLNTLDPEKNYYTICMYHNGILNDISKLKIKVIGVHQGSDVVIPPVCQPHSYQFNVEKDIFISYVGPRLHAARAQLFSMLPADNKKVYKSDTEHSLEDYCRILARSRYVVCPVGFKGINYRIAEALQYGAMPIIHTNADVPFYAREKFDIKLMFDFGIDSFDGNLIPQVNDEEDENGGHAIQDDFKIISKLQVWAEKMYTEFFTYAGCKEIVKLGLDNQQKKLNPYA